MSHYKLTLMDNLIASITFLIDNPHAQARRSLATDADGEEVLPHSPDARCWCALGRVAFDLGIRPGDMLGVYDATHKILGAVGLANRTLIVLNDLHTDPEKRQFDLLTLREVLRTHREQFFEREDA